MGRHWSIAKRLSIVLLSASFTILLLTVGVRSAAAAPSQALAPEPRAAGQVMTYTVRAGDVLWKLAKQFGVTVADLVTWNSIQNPDLIRVGQVLTISVPAGRVPVATARPVSGPLAFTWSLVSWRPDDPDYVGTMAIQATGGTLPYRYYHDGLVQAGSTFEMAWLRCHPKPGSVGVADATGAYVKQDYWLAAPYCPVGVEILEPEEGAHLKHYPRHFNITWTHTVAEPPAAYGIEIEVWENGGWHAWKQYVHQRNDRDLFFVPDEFPGDLAGRVRMWGIYEGRFAGPKTDWRNFEFRVTY